MNEETETSDEPPRKPAKTFLNAALKKTNTLQLFDDDAISESPTLSQSANKENIGTLNYSLRGMRILDFMNDKYTLVWAQVKTTSRKGLNSG